MQQKHLTSEVVAYQENNEEVTTVIYEYDTGRDVDPVTGKPPLARETIQTRKKKDTGNQQQKATQTDIRKGEVDSEAAINREELDTQQGSITGLTEDQSNETIIRGMSRFQKSLCLLGIVALIGVGLWLRWYIKKNL